MSTTIYGCVNWSTGAVEFDKICGVGNYNGCIMRGGVHDGQVRITVTDTAYCNDTYYGCINWTTGKFQVIVPDHCCYGEDCAHCPTPSQTPQYVTATLSGFTFCTGCYPTVPPVYNYWSYEENSTLNGVYLLEQQSNYCIWEYTIPEHIVQNYWDHSGCTDLISTSTDDTRIRVIKYATYIDLTVLTSGMIGPNFTYTGSQDSDCVAGTYTSDENLGCSFRNCYDNSSDTATVTLVEGDDT